MSTATSPTTPTGASPESPQPGLNGSIIAAGDASSSPVASSPASVSSRLKAYDGAYASYLAEQKARQLMQKTRKAISFNGTYDEKLPQVKTSHPAFVEEASRAGTIETTTINPLFTTNADRSRPTYHGCPSSLVDDAFFSYAANELRSISLKPSPKTVMSNPDAQAAAKTPAGARTTTMSVEEALRLRELLSDPYCRIDFIDFTGALDSLENPQPQPSEERLAESKAVITKLYGEETEESAEKVQAEVERLKGTCETYAEGITFLATKRLERTAIITDALVANKSLLEVRLGSNNFGAPNEEGRSFFGPLNRLERFIDHNKTAKILDLSNNRAGPKGIGIIAKAMCKNISIHTLNLSANDLMLDEPPEEEDDPEFEEDDPVFGEMYEALEALSEMVKKNKFLRSLSLRHNFIKPQDVNEDDEEDMGADTPIMKFFEPFKKYHRIEVLDLSANELGDTGIRLLCHCLKENQSIRHLDVSSNNITAKGLTYIADWLKTSEHIDTLIAQKNLFAPKQGTKSKKAIALCMTAATAFAEAVAANKTLQVLNLSNNHFGPEMSRCLLETLYQAAELSELSFANNELCSAQAGTDFTFVALAHIYKALAKEGNRLASLDLSGNFLQYKGVLALTRGPEAAKAILGVHASGVNDLMADSPVDIDAATAPLARFSGVLRGLVNLNLSRNAIGDEGLALLAKDLASGSVIVNLSLSGNGFTSPLPLVQLIRSPNVQLASLDISRNNFGSEGKHSDDSLRAFGTFCANVGFANGLQTLDISFNELSDAHGPALGSICRSYTAPLTTLFAVGNPLLGNETIATLVSELKTNIRLRTFRVSASSKGDHSGILAAIIDMLQYNRTIVDIDCALNMTVAEEEDVATVQRLLLLNGLHLAPLKTLLKEEAGEGSSYAYGSANASAVGGGSPLAAGSARYAVQQQQAFYQQQQQAYHQQQISGQMYGGSIGAL